jgi:hypothetical protein
MKLRELIAENDMVSFFKNLQKTDPKFKNLRIHGDPEHDELRRQDQEKRDAERQAAHKRDQDAVAHDHSNLHHLEAKYAKMKAEYNRLGGSGWQYADREQNLTSNERKARSMEHGLNQLHARIARAKKHGEQGVAEEMEPEGDTMKNSLHTIIRVATHLNKRLDANDQFPEWVSEKIGAITAMMVSVMDYEISNQELHGVSESATAGATSAASIGTVDAPHISPGKARGKKSYTGSMSGGSGTKAPPQPKVVQPKNSNGTAKNGLDIKGTSLFGGPANEAAVIKRR